MDAKQQQGGDGLKDRESEAEAARPGGRWGGIAASEQGPIGMSSATPGPMGAGGGGAAGGPGGNGSMTSDYNSGGNVTGHDSPAGEDVELAAQGGGQGQGDELVNRLGGGEGRGSGMTGAGAATGDKRAGRSDDADPATGLSGYTPDAGSPGGMGGVHGTGKAPGGVSPIEDENMKGGR